MRFTASKTDLLFSCQWWARPEVVTVEVDDSDEAALGTEVHALVEGRDVPEPSQEATDLFQSWQSHPDSRLPWLHEIAYAWDPKTDQAGVLEEGHGRDRYKVLPPGVVAGTADLVLEATGTAPMVVADIKTGRQEDLKPAAENLQLRTLALMAARCNDAREVEVRLYVLTPDEVIVDRALLQLSDLDMHAVELSALLDKVPESRPVCGSHCARKWCPALAVCPAASASADALAFAVKPVPLTINAANAPLALARLDMAKGFLKALEAALKAYADQNGGIQTPTGTWRRCEDKRESIALDGPEGAEAQAILARYGADGAVKSTLSCTKAGLAAALKKKYPARTDAATRKSEQNEILSALRAANAVKSKVIPVYRTGRSGGGGSEDGDGFDPED